MNNKLSFRNAERGDIPLILQFIKDLAAYEKMSDWTVYRVSGDSLSDLAKE